MNKKELEEHRRRLIEILKEKEQENKQLKERFERLVQEHIDTITRNEEKQQRIDKAIEEINYMVTNADITEIGAIKLKQILGDKENEKT